MNCEPLSVMMRLEVVKLKKSTKESARREAEAAQAVRAEDYPLALLRCRRNLSRRRTMNPHEVLAQQAPRPAEELNVVLVDVGAIPRARQRHGSDAARNKAMRRWSGAAMGRCSGEGKKKEGEKGRSEGERASLCRSLPNRKGPGPPAP